MLIPHPFKSGYFWLAVCAAILIGHHVWGYVGHFGFDDMHYARLSKQWADANFHTTLADHYTFRWGLLWPNGWVYRMFGVNDHSSALLPAAAVLLTLALLWRMSRRLPLGARVFALLYTTCSEWVLFYSDKIMPDVLVMAGVTAALCALTEYRWGRWQHKPRLSGAVLALSLLLSFLCKETVLLTLPLFGWLMATDLWRGQRRAFWAYTIGVGLVGAAAYLALIYAHTGDAWGRFRSIAANSYFSACSYDQLPAEHLWRRIGWELWRVFFDAGWALGWVLLLPLTLWRRPPRYLLTAHSEQDFWLLGAVGLTLLSNFMTTSPSTYLPLCPDIRHYLFAVPITALAAATGANDLLRSPLQPRHVAMLGLALTAAGLAWAFTPDSWKPYAALALAIAVLLSLRALRLPLHPLLGWGLLIFPLCWKPLRIMRAAQSSNYTHQRQLVKKHFSPTVPPHHWLVISNNVEKNVDEYLLGFDTSGVRFISFSQLSPAHVAAADSVLLIINGTTAYLSGMDWDDMPFWVKQPGDPASRTLVDSTRHIELFGQNKRDLLHRLETGK